MKNLFYLPILIREYLKSILLKPTPVTTHTREIEHACRNERRLIEYYTKRHLLNSRP